MKACLLVFQPACLSCCILVHLVLENACTTVLWPKINGYIYRVQKVLRMQFLLKTVAEHWLCASGFVCRAVGVSMCANGKQYLGAVCRVSRETGTRNFWSLTRKNQRKSPRKWDFSVCDSDISSSLISVWKCILRRPCWGFFFFLLYIYRYKKASKYLSCCFLR